MQHDHYKGFTIIRSLNKFSKRKCELTITKKYFSLEDFQITQSITDAVFKKVSKAKVGTVVQAGKCGLNASYCVKVIDENDPYYQWCQRKEKNEKSLNDIHEKIKKFLAENNLLDYKKDLEKEQRTLNEEYLSVLN